MVDKNQTEKMKRSASKRMDETISTGAILINGLSFDAWSKLSDAEKDEVRKKINPTRSGEK